MGGKYNNPFIVAVRNSEIMNYFIAAAGKIFYPEQSLAKIILNLKWLQTRVLDIHENGF